MGLIIRRFDFHAARSGQRFLPGNPPGWQRQVLAASPAARRPMYSSVSRR
jgi:hypothetical protein